MRHINASSVKRSGFLTDGVPGFNMNLSNRLSCVAGFIPVGAKVADIGSDHGLLPVYLAKNGISSHIIAVDCNADLLNSAKKNAEKHGVEDKIQFRASLGLNAVEQGEVDCVVIAGLGGETIIEILAEAPWLKSRDVKLVLQPQTKKLEMLKWLWEAGFTCPAQKNVFDNKRRYKVYYVEAAMFLSVSDVFMYLSEWAPPESKLKSDNVGLLVGRQNAQVSRVLVSLDITDDVISEAIETRANLIVAHHPLFFSLNAVNDTKDNWGGQKALTLAENKIAAICMHTNMDAAAGGVNDVLAKIVGIKRPIPFGENSLDEQFHCGRYGQVGEPCLMPEFLEKLKAALQANGLRYYDSGRPVHNVAVVGGSGDSEFKSAIDAGCDTFITGEAKYNFFLEARQRGINLIDAGHFCTENVISQEIADRLSETFPKIDVNVSKAHGQVVEFL